MRPSELRELVLPRVSELGKPMQKENRLAVFRAGSGVMKTQGFELGVAFARHGGSDGRRDAKCIAPSASITSQKHPFTLTSALTICFANRSGLPQRRGMMRDGLFGWFSIVMTLRRPERIQ